MEGDSFQMWKKFLGYGVLAVVIVFSLGLAYLYFGSPATAPPSPVKIEPNEARLARGKHIFHQVAACGDCHSQRDYTRFGGPEIEGGEGLGFAFPQEMGFPGIVVAPNITSDKETGIGNWTDGEVIRAIREGVSRDGQALFPLMPYASFRYMSDEDVLALVAYLRTLPPAKNVLPRSKIDFPVSMLIKSLPQPVGHVPPVDRSNTLKYGEYLTTLGGCGNCHTPMEKGEPLPGKRFAGGEIFRTPRGTVVSANITPDMDTGIEMERAGLPEQVLSVSEICGARLSQNRPGKLHANAVATPLPTARGGSEGDLRFFENTASGL
jgi:mono/diheme cytochrome c family protein